jgi:hypothetical protein
MRRVILSTVIIAALLAVAVTASDSGFTAPDPQAEHIAAVAAAGGVVDSILPVEEHLRRFRSTIPDTADTLRHGSASFDALVARWVVAIEQHDTAALNAMVISRAEFAWLYYPTSELAKLPYEAPPELVWGQILTGSDDGVRKALRRFGGRRLSIRDVRCARSPQVEGTNRLYMDCRTTVMTVADTLKNVRMFGTILERDGRFKFIGHGNSL